MWWCVALHRAWTTVAGADAGPILDHVIEDDTLLHRAGAVIHQAAWLAGTLVGRASLSPEQAVPRMLKGIRISGCEGDLDSNGWEPLTGSSDDNMVLPIAAWQHPADTGCVECRGCATEGVRTCTSAFIRGQSRGPSRPPGILPVARSPVLCGEPIATLCCTADRGRWLLPSTSWWPLPPRVPAQQANVE